VLIGSGAGVGAPASLPFCMVILLGLLARRVLSFEAAAHHRRWVRRGEAPRSASCRPGGLGDCRPRSYPLPPSGAFYSPQVGFARAAPASRGSAGAWRRDSSGVWRGGAVGAECKGAGLLELAPGTAPQFVPHGPACPKLVSMREPVNRRTIRRSAEFRRPFGRA
jgi:hypothetical protein